MIRHVAAVLLGTLVLFVWGGFAHTVLFVGTGFKQLPKEEYTLRSLGNSINQPGLYFFPGRDFRDTSPEKEFQWLDRFRTGPAGIIIYRPIGGEPFSSNKLLVQLCASFFTASVIVYVVSLMVPRFWERVAATALLGFLACSSVGIIYWNWYEFPTSFA